MKKSPAGPSLGQLVVKPVQLRPGSAHPRNSNPFKGSRFWEKVELKTLRRGRRTSAQENVVPCVISVKVPRPAAEDFRIHSEIYQQYAAIGSRRQSRKANKPPQPVQSSAAHRRVHSLGNSSQVFDFQAVLQFTSRSKLRR